jgi:hypothetical protein
MAYRRAATNSQQSLVNACRMMSITVFLPKPTLRPIRR